MQMESEKCRDCKFWYASEYTPGNVEDFCHFPSWVEADQEDLENALCMPDAARITDERAHYILEHLLDLCVDVMGFSTVVDKLKNEYDCELTEEELQYIVRDKA